jgi:hypothetical protein
MGSGKLESTTALAHFSGRMEVPTRANGATAEKTDAASLMAETAPSTRASGWKANITVEANFRRQRARYLPATSRMASF